VRGEVGGGEGAGTGEGGRRAVVLSFETRLRCAMLSEAERKDKRFRQAEATHLENTRCRDCRADRGVACRLAAEAASRRCGMTRARGVRFDSRLHTAWKIARLADTIIICIGEVVVTKYCLAQGKSPTKIPDRPTHSNAPATLDGGPREALSVEMCMGARSS
jgi:hypothetical protein